MLYLQHGKWGGPYRTEQVEHKTTDTPRSGQTQSGYGKNLPTQYMVKWHNIWRRVYTICYSNSGPLYIRNGTEKIVVTD